jgi:outer membrane protein assembly factor BamB
VKKIVLVLPVVVLVLSGCWPQVGFGPEHRRHNANENVLTRANVTRLREVWSVAAPGQVAEPVTSSDTVYLNDAAFFPNPLVRVRALRLTNGSVAWERTLFSSTRDVTLSVAGAAATMSGADLSAGFWATQQNLGPASCRGEQVRLDPVSGTVRSTDRDVVSFGPVTAGDVVARIERRITSSIPCAWGPVTLSVRNATTGATWSATLPGSPAANGFPPTIHDGRIYVAKEATVYAFAAAGCGTSTCPPLWSRNLEIPTHEGTRVVGSPVAGAGGQVFVATSPGRLGGGGVRALDAASGAVSWYAPSDPHSGGLALADGVLFVTAHDAAGEGTLLAYTAAGCGVPTCDRPQWSGRSDARFSSAPAVAGGVVYVGGAGGVYAFDSRGCGGSLCTPLSVVRARDTSDVLHLAVAQGRLLAATATGLTTFAPS